MWRTIIVSKINQELVQPSQIGEPDINEIFEYDEFYIQWSDMVSKDNMEQLDSDMQSEQPPF